jgi:hypothetical protein
MTTRYALIASDKTEAIARFLPSHYRLCGVVDGQTVIYGKDTAGWTLHGYVLPRLASGLYFGEEIDLSHPVMKKISDAACDDNAPTCTHGIDIALPCADCAVASGEWRFTETGEMERAR